MHKYVLDELNTQIDKNIEKLLPKLEENSSAAINTHIINALQSLREIFALQEPFCQTLEFWEKSPKTEAPYEALQTIEGLALIIWIAELMATRMNCPIGSNIDSWLYELQLFNHTN